jgi:hypothetical protein
MTEKANPQAKPTAAMPSPAHEWPRLRWRPLALYSLVGTVLGALLFFFPELATQSMRDRRLVLGAVLVASPLVVPALVWLGESLLVVIRRVRVYPLLHRRASLDADELDQARSSIFSLLKVITGARAYEVTKAGLQGGQLYIAISTQGEHDLVIGRDLIAVHMAEERPVGLFRITEIRSAECLAVAVHSVDKQLLSDVRQRGELTLLPNIAAISIPLEGRT